MPVDIYATAGLARGQLTRHSGFISSPVPVRTIQKGRVASALPLHGPDGPMFAHARADALGLPAALNRNVVPSTHMRCITTAILRASATVARLLPWRPASLTPQARSTVRLR